MADSVLDKMDRRILEILGTNGRIPIVELAEQVGLSPTPCAARVKRMVADGVIKGYTVRIDHEKAGLSIMAIVLIRLKENTTQAGEDFSKAIEESISIENCFMTLGRVDYILHIFASNLNNLEDLLRRDIASLPHILSLETILVLDSKHG